MPASEGEALLGVANFRSGVKVRETVARERRQQSMTQLPQVIGYWNWLLVKQPPQTRLSIPRVLITNNQLQ